LTLSASLMNNNFNELAQASSLSFHNHPMIHHPQASTSNATLNSSPLAIESMGGASWMGMAGIPMVMSPASLNSEPISFSGAEVDRRKHPSGIIPTLQNIVSTVNMGTRLDLKTIALHARNAEYNPKRFAAVIMRIRDPKTTALIFASGKMVCTGAKSEDASRLAARKYARIIQKLGFPTKFTDFKIQNIVGSTDVKFPIRLEGLSIAHAHYSSNYFRV